MRTFKEYLYQDIIKQELTPTQISTDLGHKRCETVAKWLRGRNYPSPKQIIKICEVYKYPQVKLSLWITIKKNKDANLTKLLCKSFGLQ